MPLHDHFRGPLSFRPWESFHAQWAGSIAADLNRRLPQWFVADAPMHLGSAVAADVVEYEIRGVAEVVNGHPSYESADDDGLVAVATEMATYAPPATSLSMPAKFPTEVKVEVRDTTRQYRVVAVIELVSPGNKKEIGEREQFAAKCLSYLGKGLGLVVLDIVTARSANLHNALVQLSGHGIEYAMAGDPPTYAAAYRPVRRGPDERIDLWLWPLEVGESLPTVPLAIEGFGCVRIDLEATYTEACTRCRIA